MKYGIIVIIFLGLGLARLSAKQTYIPINSKCDSLISIIYSGYLDNIGDELDVLNEYHGSRNAIKWNDTLELSEIILKEFSIIPYIEKPNEIPYNWFILMPIGEMKDWFDTHKESISSDKITLIVVFNTIYQYWGKLANLVYENNIYFPNDNNVVLSGIAIRKLTVDIIRSILGLSPQSEYLAKQLSETERLMACVDSIYIRDIDSHILNLDNYISNASNPLIEPDEWNDTLAVTQVLMTQLVQYLNNEALNINKHAQLMSGKEWIDKHIALITPVKLKLLLILYMMKTAWPYIIESTNNSYGVSIFSSDNGLKYKKLIEYLIIDLFDDIENQYNSKTT